MSRTAADPTTPAADALLFLPVLELRPNPKNPRQTASADALRELGDSVRAHGVIEPLIVRAVAGVDGYEVVAGSRRLAAARDAGIEHVPVVVKTLSDVEAFDLATIENVQRADMHPVDEALAYAEMRKRPTSVEGIAARVGKTESHVYRRLKLLELETDLQHALHEDRLSLGHAEALLRLSPAKRKIAAHPTNGVVWTHSPLLDYSEKWTPQRDDLRPLHDLEEFIRDKTFFDPADESVKHFQPELGAAIEQAVDDQLTDTTDGERDVEDARASMVQLSDDPMARMRLGAKPNDPVPLTPSKWKAVGKKPCAHQVTGVIVHGGPARVLQVCTKRSCAIHWPQKPKTKKPAASSSGAKRENVAESWEARQKRERAEQEIATKRWAKVQPEAVRQVVTHVGAMKLDVPFVKVFLDQVDIWNGLFKVAEVQKLFGVALSSKSVGLVLALSTIHIDDRDALAVTSKAWRFDMAPIDAALKKLETDAKKAAAPAPTKKPAKKGGGK